MRSPCLALYLCSLTAAASACGDDTSTPADGSGTTGTTGDVGTTASPTTSPEDATTGSDSGSTSVATETLDTGSESTGAEGCVVYVDAATGDDEAAGDAWATAKRTLQAGLAQAEVDGCEIWVVAGTYYPSENVDVDASFVLFPGAHVYGALRAARPRWTSATG
jgi:hypothetical protein